MTAMEAPPVSQPMEALEQANRIRLARAAAKRQINSGEIKAADVILDPSPELEGMRVGDVLNAQHRWGWTRVRRFLSVIPMSERKTLGSMTARQREVVAAALAGERPPARLPVPSVRPAPRLASAPALPKPTPLVPKVKRTRHQPPPPLIGVSPDGLRGLVGQAHRVIWHSGDHGLMEIEISKLLRADREDVAEACGRLLEAGAVMLRPDGTYFRPVP
jgi:hypothetical protein